MLVRLMPKRFEGPEDPVRMLALRVIGAGVTSALWKRATQRTLADRDWILIPNDNFQMWCDMADLDVEYLRERTRQRMVERGILIGDRQETK